MVRQLKARRSAILDHLPAELLNEFEAIETTIRQIDVLLRQHGEKVDVPIPSHLAGLVDENARPKGTRQPLTVRKKTLFDFLTQHGPATRAEILAGTDIPQGTLSALLTDEMFVKVDEGRWGVRN